MIKNTIFKKFLDGYSLRIEEEENTVKAGNLEFIFIFIEIKKKFK
jgi:hypothetical protein